MAWGPAYDDSGFVFTREDGSPLHPHTVAWHFERAVRDAGLPKIRMHDLRHSYASLALRAGVSPKIVSARLGHSTVAFTLDTCCHVAPSWDAEGAEQAAAAIFGTL